MTGLITSLALAAAATAQLDPLWTARYTSAPDAIGDEARDVIVDAAGNVYVAGTTGTWGQLSLANIVVLKYAPDGTELWTKIYDGPSSSQDLASAAALAPDGAVLVAGRSEGDFVVIKLDPADGSTVWVRQHDGGGIEHVNAMTVDPAGFIYVTGQSWTTEQNDYYTIKVDPNGHVLWTARYAGPGAFLFAHDVAYAVAVDGAGDVFVTGASNAPGSASEDYVTIKYDGATGQQLWLDRYSGAGANDVAYGLALDAGGDAYVTGGSYQSGWKYVTIRYAGDDGSRMWVAIDSPQACNIGTRVVLDAGGDVYVTGTSDPDCDESNFNENITTIRYAGDDGTPMWTSIFGSNAVGAFDVPSDLGIDAAGNVYVTGANTGLAVLLRYDAAAGGPVEISTLPGGPNEITGGSALAFDPDRRVVVSGLARNVNTENRDILTMQYPAAGGERSPDLDGDLTVGINDLLMLLAAWGPCDGACPADLDGDGAVGISDLLMLLAAWS